MGTIINRRRACGGKSLPYDAEIEYLQSNGNQWIDTGINYKAGEHPTIKIKINISGIPGGGINAVPVGSRNGTAIRNGIYIYNGGMVSRINASIYTYTSPKINTDYSIVSNSENGFIINDINISEDYIALNRNLIYNTYLFAHNINGGKYEGFYGKIYYCKLYINDINVRDFIPVRVGNVGYMYDKVSGQLFGNSGTGAFILGPDKMGGGKCLIINMLRGYSAERRAA